MIIEMPSFIKRKVKSLKVRPEFARKCGKVDSLIANKKMSVADACRMVGISTETYYRYKKARR